MSAYAKAKDVDGAYDAWCRMREQGLVPNRITVVQHSFGLALWLPTHADSGLSCVCEKRPKTLLTHAQRILAEAFSGNLRLATELIREAHQAQAEEVQQNTLRAASGNAAQN